jgi:type IV secretory pathway VirB10-like protein
MNPQGRFVPVLSCCLLVVCGILTTAAPQFSMSKLEIDGTKGKESLFGSLLQGPAAESCSTRILIQEVDGESEDEDEALSNAPPPTPPPASISAPAPPPTPPPITKSQEETAIDEGPTIMEMMMAAQQEALREKQAAEKVAEAKKPMGGGFKKGFFGGGSSSSSKKKSDVIEVSKTPAGAEKVKDKKTALTEDVQKAMEEDESPMIKQLKSSGKRGGLKVG